MNEATLAGAILVVGMVVLGAVKDPPYPESSTATPAATSSEAPAPSKSAIRPIAELPDHTPYGTPVAKRSFYSSYPDEVETPEGLLRVADFAVAKAHSVGLRCDSITALHPWLWGRGWTMKCNEFDYTYYIQDKGDGWKIRIAD